jgi:hypothetical protein
LIYVWANFIDIACISEENDPVYLSSTMEYHEDPKKYLKYLQHDFTIISKLDFNPEIQQNIIEIKLKTLHYSLRIFEYFSQIANRFPKAVLSSNMDLFKLFLINSLDDRVLLRTCECIEVFKKKFLFFFENVCIFDVQIEEILINKKSQMIKGLGKKSRFSIPNLPLLESPMNSPMIPLDFSLDSKRSSSNDLNMKLKGLFVYPVQNDQSDGNKQPENSQTNLPEIEEEEDPIENEKKLKKVFIEELDRWLCYDETNLISLNENISIALKLIENLEIFLNFIINPLKFPIESYVSF